VRDVSDPDLFPPNDFSCHTSSPALLGADNPTNTIRVTEIFIGGLGSFYGGIVMLVHPGMLRILILSIEIGKLLRSRGLAAFSRSTWGPWFKVPRDADIPAIAARSWMGRVSKKRPVRQYFLISQVLALAIALIVCCVAIPMHIVAEIHPPSGGTYIDSRPLPGGIDVGAWTDCFDLKPPTDGLGFWSLWWGGKTAWLLHAIGLV
jgi:hypothetical protein